VTVIPRLGQAPENFAHSSPEKSADVFRQYHCGPDLSNDAKHFVPQTGAGSLFDSGPASGAGDVLTRKASTDDIHESAPGASVEGSDVVPDRGVVKASVCDARIDDLLAVRLDLAVADGSCRHDKSKSEVNSAVPGE
jgi:hypothetical protein